MVTQMSLFDGPTRKKMGQESVLEHNEQWKDNMFSNISSMPRGFKFTSDDIRRMFTPIVGQPDHNNGWGSLFSAAAKAKMIRKTGSYVKSDRPEAHSRMLSVWLKI